MLFSDKKNEPLKSSYVEWHKKLKVLEAPRIAQPLSQELDILRQTLLFSGLEVIRTNLNRGETVLKFFEIGKSYSYYKEKYKEREWLAIWFSGDTNEMSWVRKNKPVNFVHLYGIVQELLAQFGIQDLEVIQQEALGYVNALVFTKNGKKIIEMGEVHPEILAKMGIKSPVFFAEIKLHKLLKMPPRPLIYQAIATQPAVVRDLSLALPEKAQFSQIKALIQSAKISTLQSIQMVDYYKGKNTGKATKSYTLRFVLQHPHKTLAQKEIEKTMSRIAQILQKQLHATIR